jgi:hypothetical protein
MSTPGNQELKNVKTMSPITSSARSSSDAGTSMPISFAVFRLTTVRNFVGCSDVARLLALEDATIVDACLTIGICQVRSIAHEPADLGILTP